MSPRSIRPQWKLATSRTSISSYGKTTSLKSVSIPSRPRPCTAPIGPSGCGGKSTLLQGLEQDTPFILVMQRDRRAGARRRGRAQDEQPGPCSARVESSRSPPYSRDVDLRQRGLRCGVSTSNLSRGADEQLVEEITRRRCPGKRSRTSSTPGPAYRRAAAAPCVACHRRRQTRGPAARRADLASIRTLEAMKLGRRPQAQLKTDYDVIVTHNALARRRACRRCAWLLPSWRAGGIGETERMLTTIPQFAVASDCHHRSLWMTSAI